jgi:sRNA-binding regulator protein Hfq
MRICAGLKPGSLLLALFFLVPPTAVHAVQVKLNNGTVLNGDIVDQNENFIVIQVGQAKLSIAKNSVSEIAGRTASAGGAGTASAPAAGAMVSSGVAQGKNVEITLNNGSKFKGAIVAMDDRVIEIETAGGSRLDLYKVNIADVRDLAASGPAAPTPPAPAAIPAPASPVPVAAVPPATAAPAPSAVPAEAVPGKMIEITLKSGAKFKGTVTAADDRHIMLEVARGSSLDFYRSIIVGVRDLSTPGFPAGVSSAPQAQPSPPAALSGTVSAQVPPIKPAAAAAPATSVQQAASSSEPAGEAIPGTMVEIVLKSGARFKGIVATADDRHIMLEVSRGSTLDFYRQVIVGIKILEPPPVSAGQGTAASLPQPAPAAAAPAAVTAATVVAPPAPQPTPQPVPSVAAVPAPTVFTPLPVAATPPTVAEPKKSTEDKTVSQPVSASPPPVPAVQKPPVSAPIQVAAAAPLVPAVQKSEESPSKPQETKPPPVTPVPVAPAAPAEQQKAPDGRNECVLKNGTILRGKIKSDNDRYMTFSTDDMTLNILRRLIKAVDGMSNADTVMPARGKTGAAAPEKAAAVEGLARAISDSSSDIGKKAVAALAAMGDTIAVLPLAAALRSGDPGVRKAASEALGDIRDSRAILPLCAALQDPVDSVRAAVQFSLKLHSEIPLLIGALDNKNGLVRDNAAQILWLMTGKNFGNDKQGWVDWYAENRGEK